MPLRLFLGTVLLVDNILRDDDTCSFRMRCCRAVMMLLSQEGVSNTNMLGAAMIKIIE